MMCLRVSVSTSLTSHCILETSFVSVVKYTLKSFYGRWYVRFRGISFTIVFTPGIATISGMPIKVTPSINRKYSFRLGWFMFSYKGWTYFIKMSGGKRVYVLRINKRGKVTKGRAGKGLRPKYD